MRKWIEYNLRRLELFPLIKWTFSIWILNNFEFSSQDSSKSLLKSSDMMVIKWANWADEPIHRHLELLSVMFYLMCAFFSGAFNLFIVFPYLLVISKIYKISYSYFNLMWIVRKHSSQIDWAALVVLLNIRDYSMSLRYKCYWNSII